MNLDDDFLLPIRRAINALVLLNPSYFLAWVALGTVFNGMFALGGAAAPDNRIAQELAHLYFLHYSIAYLIAWAVSKRQRDSLVKEDEDHVRLLERLANEGELTKMEKRQVMRQALLVELDRRRETKIHRPSERDKNTNSPKIDAKRT